MPTGTFNTIQPPAPPDPYEAQTAGAQHATTTGYDPSKFTVKPEQTVQHQLEGIVAKDSPLIQQAERRANQAMNDRGLLHSSMAVGAAREGVLNAALPIAQHDAGTFNTAMTNTVNAENAAKNFKAAADNSASLANAQLGTNVSLANADAANKAKAQDFEVKANYGLAGFDSNTKIALTTLDNQYRQLLQSNQSAASMFNQVAQNIAQISQSTTLSDGPGGGKDNAIQSQLNALNEALRTIDATNIEEASRIEGLNLGQYFQGTFSSGLGNNATPQQIDQRRTQLQRAIDDAKKAVPVWENTDWRYSIGAMSGPNASERAAQWFTANEPGLRQAYVNAQRALDDFNALYPVALNGTLNTATQTPTGTQAPDPNPSPTPTPSPAPTPQSQGLIWDPVYQNGRWVNPNDPTYQNYLMNNA